MDAEQKYIFDLNGYLLFKKLVPIDLIEQCNRILEHLEQVCESEYPYNVLQGKPKSAEELYISNIIEADSVFVQLMKIPEVIDVINTVSLGLYRLNHTYSITRKKTGYTYMHMGGTPLHPKASYAVNNGEIFSLLTKLVIPLQHNDADDGGFAVIPGSHKSAFTRPWGNHPEENPALVHIAAEPGDVIVFTEALAHGSLVNYSGNTRRTLFYCYSVGYMPDWGKLGLSFSENFLSRLSDEERNIVTLKTT